MERQTQNDELKAEQKKNENDDIENSFSLNWRNRF